MSRLDEIEKRAENATKGPWTYGSGCVFTDKSCVTDGVFEYVVDSFRAGNEPNAEFIAHAREDIPWLVAEVKRLRAQDNETRGRLTDALKQADRLSGEVMNEKFKQLSASNLLKVAREALAIVACGNEPDAAKLAAEALEKTK